MIEAPQRKLREARFFCARLCQERKNPDHDPEVFGFYLSAFLSSARSVTFALQSEEKDKYDAWFPGWKGARSEDERGLLDRMNAQRVEEVHRRGAETSEHWEMVSYLDIIRASEGGRRALSIYYNYLTAHQMCRG